MGAHGTVQQDATVRDEQRARVHAMWAAVAEGWSTHADRIDARGAAVADRMIGMSAPRPGERVLELACGPGGLGLAAARRVGPEGRVVLTDVAAEMTAIAARRAAETGITNIETRERDLEGIAEPDATFDVVLCREGLMFAVDPVRAVAEMHRVLRPGGRLAIAVWGPRERNPWLAALLDAFTAVTGVPVPPPGVPGPFSLSHPVRLAELLTDASLLGVRVEEFPVPLTAASGDAWWDWATALAGPLAARLGSLPDAGRQAVRADALKAVSIHRTDEGLEIPGLALLASARAGG